MKLLLFLVGGGALGALLGYVSQCAGGSCPLMCEWWRGAIFGLVAGLAMWFAGRADHAKAQRVDTNSHENP